MSNLCVCAVLHEHPVKLKDGGSFRFGEGGIKDREARGENEKNSISAHPI